MACAAWSSVNTNRTLGLASFSSAAPSDGSATNARRQRRHLMTAAPHGGEIDPSRTPRGAALDGGTTMTISQPIAGVNETPGEKKKRATRGGAGGWGRSVEGVSAG